MNNFGIPQSGKLTSRQNPRLARCGHHVYLPLFDF